ncbi:MAG: hypothetical protein LBI27_03035 [Clostridiales bacterium]|jgi:hypothetical protein|nr:hypothetical protein [Clostridiales bacterium]
MENKYIINRWALIRRGELSVTPENIEIHPVFLHTLSREDFESAFRQIGYMFYQIMTDISKNPERFAMPLYDESTTLYGATKAQESRYAAWRPMWLLYTIFIHGNLVDCKFSVDIPAFRQSNKVKNSHLLFKLLSDYGFVFSGLSNYKIAPKTKEFTVEYPDNPNVINVMALVARKAAKVMKDDLFYKWSFRLIEEAFDVFSYTDPIYAVYDKTRTSDEKNFIKAFHIAMKKKCYFYQSGGGNEGPGIRYYDKESVMKRKGPYLFQLWDNKGDLQLHLRIRSVEKCLSLYNEISMPDEITEMFRYSDSGCINHSKGTCYMGIEYIFEGITHWHCGCCSTLFWLRPKAENIQYYVKMLEIGEKK